ncbi:hypothetical protein C0991_004151 [Blastosporella zonata]|nr:hypothetical protein C0991_004151 [Blastosporella zonata]
MAALAPIPPKEIKALSSKPFSSERGAPITLFTELVASCYAADTRSGAAPRLRLVSITSFKEPASFEHEYASVCLLDVTKETKYYIQLHRGPAPPTPSEEDKPEDSSSMASSAKKKGAPASDMAVLRYKEDGDMGLFQISFPADTTKTLLDVLIIAETVYKHIDTYRLYDTNCFAHSSLIMRMVASDFGVPQKPLAFSHRAGKNHGVALSNHANMHHFEEALQSLQGIKEEVYQPIHNAQQELDQERAKLNQERAKLIQEREERERAQQERDQEREERERAQQERDQEREERERAQRDLGEAQKELKKLRALLANQGHPPSS